MNRALIASLLIAAIARADDVLPQRPAFSRYQAMLNRSPFAIATPTGGVADFAKDLYVANAAHSPDGDMVTIGSSTDKNFKKYPTTNKPDDGYAISSIEWSDKLGQTKVTITKDGKYATLSFNQALLSQPIAAQPPPPLQLPPQQQVTMQPQPGVSAPQNYIKPAPIPSLPPAAPAVPQPAQAVPAGRTYSRGIIPRNPNVAAPTPVPTPNQDNGD